MVKMIINDKEVKPLEKVVQKKISQLLKDDGWHVDIITSGLYGGNGISDIIAVKRGKYMAIEVKRFPGMKPSKLQASWLADVARHGGIAKCVGSVEEMEKILTWFNSQGSYE
jgi:hypothetical protein